MNKKSRIPSLILITILSAFAFVPFYAKSETKNSFNVGIIAPLTGDLADYGVSIRQGFDLAVSEAPQGFTKIRFIYEDSRYDANTAVSAFQKLRATKGADLYYAWGVSPTEALIPIAESNKLPLLVETTLKESTTNRNYIVRAARTGERIARSLSEEVHKRKLKSVSLIVADIPFYDDIINHLKVLLPEKGVKITRVRNILPSENDMRAYLPELKAENA